MREFERFSVQQDMERVWRQERETSQWVEEFEGKRPIEKVDDLREISGRIAQIDDPKLQKSNFMRFMNEIKDGKVEIDSENNQLHVNTSKLEETDHETWANEFEQHQLNTEKWLEDFERQQVEQNPDWDNAYKEFQQYQNFANGYLSTELEDYEFVDVEDNPYANYPDAFKKGVELFQDGHLSQAILALEAELHKNPSNSQCWHLLGQAHAENDKDTKAIQALLKAVDADKNNLDAAMALAVSFTNDLYRDRALSSLASWIEKNPNYHSLYVPFDPSSAPFEEYHNHVTNMFIQAARSAADKGIDADVQIGLGLLYNLSQDYDKAVDCFRAALSVRPDDYLLWNKLGATLANSHRSEEALSCYFNALKIKPSYVRARSNLGISYMILQDYPNAIRHFLGALSMHPEARHMWTNLQMTFASFGREDLVEKSLRQNVDDFRDEFEF